MRMINQICFIGPISVLGWATHSCSRVRASYVNEALYRLALCLTADRSIH